MAIKARNKKIFQDVVRYAAAQMVSLDVHSGGYYVGVIILAVPGGSEA